MGGNAPTLATLGVRGSRAPVRLPFYTPSLRSGRAVCDTCFAKVAASFIGWRLPLRRDALPPAVWGLRPVVRGGCRCCLAFTGTPQPPSRIPRAFFISFCAPWCFGLRPQRSVSLRVFLAACAWPLVKGGRGPAPPFPPPPASVGSLSLAFLAPSLRFGLRSLSARSGTAVSPCKGQRAAPFRALFVALWSRFALAAHCPLQGGFFLGYRFEQRAFFFFNFLRCPPFVPRPTPASCRADPPQKIKKKKKARNRAISKNNSLKAPFSAPSGAPLSAAGGGLFGAFSFSHRYARHPPCRGSRGVCSGGGARCRSRT